MKAFQIVLFTSILSLLIYSPSVAGDAWDNLNTRINERVARERNESNEKIVMMIVGGGVVAAALIAGAILLKKK